MVQCTIRRHESAKGWIVQSGLQPIHAEVAVIVVSAVADGVVAGAGGGTAVVVGSGRIAPCVVGIRYQLNAIVRIHSYHVALQVLFVPEALPRSIGGRRTVHHADGGFILYLRFLSLLL